VNEKAETEHMLIKNHKSLAGILFY